MIINKKETAMSDIYLTGNTLKSGSILIKNAHILAADQNFCRLLGYTENSLKGQNASIIFQSQEEFDFIDNKCMYILRLEDSVSFRAILANKNNESINFIIHARLLHKGKINSGLVFTCIDISFHKAMQDSFVNHMDELKEKNNEKDKFISVLAHDLLSLVGNSVNFIRLLEGKDNDWGKKEVVTQNLYQNTHNTFSLLKSLIAWSKVIINKERFLPAKINVKSIFHNVIQLCTIPLKQKEIKVDVLCDKGASIWADPYMFESIIRNLMLNAIKYSNKGSTIKNIALIEDDKLIIEILDSGVGMPQDKVNNLFKLGNTFPEPGTNREKGTGLGLHIVNEYVKLHKAEINIKSEINSGTRVSLKFPIMHNSRLCKN